MISALLLAVFSVLLSCLYFTLRYNRSRFRDFPQLPNSFLFGHLKAFDQVIRSGIPDRHPDQVFLEIHEKLGRPPMFLVGLWPVQVPMLLVCDHDIAEQISKISNLFPWSTPKADITSHLNHLLGPTNILSLQGHEWKQTRRKFNYTFSHQNLSSFIPTIVDKAGIFLKNLDHFAATQADCSLMKMTTNLTFDIIGAVVMDMDLNAQCLNEAEQGELVSLHLELIESFTGAHAESAPSWMTPRKAMKRRRLGNRINQLIDDIILETKKKVEQDPEYASKSVLANRLRTASDFSSGPELPNETRDQVKVFLVAGHDTTSIVLSFAFYELSRSPRTLVALRAELDDLFGPETHPSAVQAKLRGPDGEALLGKMEYVSAVIKEALRLYPPAGTARMSSPGTNFQVTSPSDGKTYCLDGLTLYNCAPIIHRDRNVYGENANEFVPERWLGSAAKEIPASAWRPFERGPRNCIGQELANLEARIVIALVARKYDFVKVGLSGFLLDEKDRPLLGEDGRVETQSNMYNILQITSKPADGMMMKVSLANYDEKRT
ncbi:Cytochrome P450 [Rhypophila sp. PSN 637]